MQGCDLRGRASAWAVLAALAAAAGADAAAQKGAAGPSPDVRAERVLERMTQDEKLALVNGHFPRLMKPVPPGVIPSGGYVPGVERLGVPALRETDASLGVANAGRGPEDVVALPSGLSLAATWNPSIAYRGGAMIGKEARQKGFNVLLAGGMNLTRDPFNGRNFEYLGEDPLLAGVMAGASVRGIQSQRIVSTVKHFALNAQETGRRVVDTRISEAALRESDLLAFQIAIERGRPGAVMCAYNKVNGTYACENPHLLTEVLKNDWGFKGWVMSDWGAVGSLQSASAGLDQESGEELDRPPPFQAPLREALANGSIPATRLDDMARRILRSMFANGLTDGSPEPAGLNIPADDAVARAAAEAGIVLLKNTGGVLPLSTQARRIAVIGGHADVGVLSGGGSSQVIPRGSTVAPKPPGAPIFIDGVVYHPSAPLGAITARAKGGTRFASGQDVDAAVALAKASDVAVVFAEQWTTEGYDTAIELSEKQERLIRAVAAANPNTIVVLENGGPLLMPWIDAVKGVVEAWYPGGQGGEAIARVLFGEVDPVGRLPVTLAATADQLVRSPPPGLAGTGSEKLGPTVETPFAVDYVEGSSVGYRWFAEKGRKPLFPFGYGLSYTRFAYGRIAVTGGPALKARVTVTNTGRRAGVETVQLYLRSGPARSQQRLLGWARAALEPGETKTVDIVAEPRLLANWDEARHAFRIEPGRYRGLRWAQCL